MSNTPLVKTSGRASSARRGCSSARGQSLATKAGSIAADCRRRRRARRRLAATRPEADDARALRIVDLELLQQGQARAARKGRRRSARKYVATGGGATSERARAPRRSPRSRSSAPTPGPLCESQAILEYIEAAYPEPPLAAARSVRRRQGARAGRSSSTCTSSWWRASSIRRRSSAARISEGNAARVRTRARAQHRRLQAPGPLRALRRRRPSSRQADCSAWARCRWSRWRPSAIYGEDLLAAAGIDWKALQPAGRRAAERAEGGRRPQGGAGTCRGRSPEAPAGEGVRPAGRPAPAARPRQQRRRPLRPAWPSAPCGSGSAPARWRSCAPSAG